MSRAGAIANGTVECAGGTNFAAAATASRFLAGKMELLS